MQNELVSIIIPVHNRASYLPDCLESLLKQTWSNLEILAIDDHSTDDSRAVLLKYSQIDQRIKVYSSEKEGAGAARNVGLEHAAGTYLMFVDSDDYVAVNFVERMVTAMSSSQTDVVQCSYARVYDDRREDYIPPFSEGSMTGWEFAEKQISFNGFYTVSTIVWNKIYKRSIWDNCRFDAVHRFEDVFTSYQVMYPCKKILLIPDVLYYWVIHEDSTSLSDMRNDNCTDIIRAWVEKTRYFKQHGQMDLVGLNRRRCYYVASQHIYRIRKNNGSKRALQYHREIIKRYFPLLMKDKRWSLRTKLRMFIIRVNPEFFGWLSLHVKIDFEK